MKARFDIFLNHLLFIFGYVVAMGILVFSCINLLSTTIPVILKGLAFVPLLFIALLLSYSLLELWSKKS